MSASGFLRKFYRTKQILKLKARVYSMTDGVNKY